MKSSVCETQMMDTDISYLIYSRLLTPLWQEQQQGQQELKQLREQGLELEELHAEQVLQQLVPES